MERGIAMNVWSWRLLVTSTPRYDALALPHIYRNASVRLPAPISMVVDILTSYLTWLTYKHAMKTAYQKACASCIIRNISQTVQASL